MGIVSRQSSESTLKSLNRHRLQTRTQLLKLPLRLTLATLHIFFSQHARDVSRHFAAVPVEQFPEPYRVHRLDVVGVNRTFVGERRIDAAAVNPLGGTGSADPLARRFVGDETLFGSGVFYLPFNGTLSRPV